MKKLLLSVAFLATFAQAGEWYEGGTLHTAKAKEWYSANYQNKLATAGDFIAKTWADKNLTSKVVINSMDDTKKYADALVKCVDVAISNKNGKLNKQAVTQNVTTLSVLCMATMGWLK